MATTKAKPRRQSNAWVENIKTIVYAGLIAVGVRTVAFEPFNIPSGSMIPTLLVGDYLFVAKYSYGYSTFSLPFAPPLFSGRLFGSLPKRGDVVVFKYPRDTSIDYIKRIVGLPGDRIQVREGQLYINGELCPRRPEGDYLADDNGIKMMRRLYRRRCRTASSTTSSRSATTAGSTTPRNISCRRTMCSPWATTATTAPTAVSWTAGRLRASGKPGRDAPKSCFSRSTPNIPGGNSGSGRSRSAGAGCLTPSIE